MLDLSDKVVTAIIIYMFKELKETMFKELKESMIKMIQWIENFNKVIEIIEKNQVKIL